MRWQKVLNVPGISLSYLQIYTKNNFFGKNANFFEPQTLFYPLINEIYAHLAIGITYLNNQSKLQTEDVAEKLGNFIK